MTDSAKLQHSLDQLRRLFPDHGIILLVFPISRDFTVVKVDAASNIDRADAIEVFRDIVKDEDNAATTH